jgi:hypothetical protein
LIRSNKPEVIIEKQNPNKKEPTKISLNKPAKNLGKYNKDDAISLKQNRI